MFVSPEVTGTPEDSLGCRGHLRTALGPRWESWSFQLSWGQRAVDDLTLEERTCLNLLFSSCMLGDLGRARWRPPLRFSPLPPPSARTTWNKETISATTRWRDVTDQTRSFTQRFFGGEPCGYKTNSALFWSPPSHQGNIWLFDALTPENQNNRLKEAKDLRGEAHFLIKKN